MPPSKAQKQAAARARAGRARVRLGLLTPLPQHSYDESPAVEDSDDGDSVCCWDGGVNSWSDNESDDAEWVDEEDLQAANEQDEDASEAESLQGDELMDSLVKEAQQELEMLKKITPYEKIKTRTVSSQEWAKAESKVGVKNGLSPRTARRHDKDQRDKEKTDANLRKTASAAAFRKFFAPARSSRGEGGSGSRAASVMDLRDIIDEGALFDGYLSDLSEDSRAGEDEEVDIWYDEELYDAPEPADPDEPPMSSPTSSPHPSPSPSQPSASSAASQPVSPDPSDNEDAFPVRAPPPLKRRRLDVPVREARARKAAKVREKRKQALRAMKRLLSSKKPFQGGPNGLLSYRMRAIQACLHMVVEDKMGLMAASRVAAKANPPEATRKYG